jgi:hypothetical protein
LNYDLLKGKVAMKSGMLSRLVFVAITVGALQNADAGSAVGTDGLGHNIYAFGRPVEMAKQSVFSRARRNGWNVRIIASTDQTGYGAIAVALHPSGHGSLIGVALGKRSATEADSLAIEHCLKAGGINPQVKWAFRG